MLFSTVLIVDDEPAVLSLASLILQKEGYRILTATDGAEGLKTFQERKAEISCVVTDVQMPVMDGIHMAEAIFSESPAARIVFVSGFSPTQEIARLVEEFHAKFLPKPFTLPALVAALA